MRSKLQKFRKYLPINRNYAESLLTGYGLMVITIVIQLVLIPLYITHLGKEKFGVLAMIMAANNYAAIGITWLSGGMARILAERAAFEDREGFCAAYAFSKTVFVLYALGALSVFWLIAPWLIGDALADTEILVAVILSCVYFVLAYEYNADRQAFIARHWQAKGNLREAGGQVVFAGVVGIGLYSGIGLLGVVAAQIAGILFTRFLAWHHWKHDGYGLKWSWPIPGARAFWQRVSGSVGRDYVLYGILLLTLQADVLLVGWLAGSEAAATYYLLWRIPEVCILLLWRIPSSYAPHLIAMEARGEHEGLNSNYRKGLIAMIALAGVGAMVYGIAGNWIVHIWVGASAPEGYIPYLIAAAAMFSIAVTRWPADIAYTLANTRPLVKIAALEISTKLFFLTLLFGTFGYLSPLLAVILAHTLGVFYLYLWLGKNTCNIKRLRSNHIISQ